MARSKRKTSDHDEEKTPSKKKRGANVHELGGSIFYDLLRESGIVFSSHGKKNDELLKEQAIFERDLASRLKQHQNYPQVIDTFVEGFSKHIEEKRRLHTSLLPTYTPEDCDISVAGSTQNSLVRLLLAVEALQPSVMRVLMEKLAEIADEEDLILEDRQRVNLPRLIMTQFRWLDTIINPQQLMEKMFEVISITGTDVQREIIACIPEVIDDVQHADVARQLKSILTEQPQLTVAVLDALSNLNLKNDLILEVQHTVIQTLPSVALDDLPVMVKFLLQTVTQTNAYEVVAQLRLHLHLDSSETATVNKQRTSGSTERESELLTLDAIHSAIRFQRTVAEAWLKVIQNVTSSADHKETDLLVLFVLHASNYHKSVESIFRNKVRAGRFTEKLVQTTFSKHAQSVREYSVSVLSLAQNLLRSVQPAVSLFAGGLYAHAFLTFDAYGQQEVVGSLVTHIGSGIHSEVESSLDVLVQLVEKNVAKMTPFAVFIKGVFDYLEHLSIGEIRKLYYMLTKLAFRTGHNDALLQDEMYIVIRKQLSNNNPKYKRMGVIGAVMVVQNSATNSESLSHQGTDSTAAADDAASRQAIGLLQQLKTSTQHTGAAAALLMDELANAVQRTKLASKVECWISENVLNDFQDDFVVDVDTSNGKKDDSLQFGLDDETEGAIAINLLHIMNTTSAANSTNKQNRNVSALCLAPHFRLLQTCESREHNGDLEGIDALLGCPLYLPDMSLADKLSSVSLKERQQFCDVLFHTCNWFTEVINAFSSQSEAEMKAKVIARISNLTTVCTLLEKCIPAIPNYEPPLANFVSDVNNKPHISANVKTKKPPAKGKKKKKKADDADNSKDAMDDEGQISQPVDKESQLDASCKEQPATVDLNLFRQYLREFDMDVFNMLKVGFITKSALDTEMNTKDVTTLRMQPADLQLLLTDLVRKLQHILIASEPKRHSFLRSKTDTHGFFHLDELGAVEVAKRIICLLPAICDHLEATNAYFQSMMAANDGLMDGPWGCTQETNLMSSCHCLLFQVLLSFFSWNGFAVTERRDMLKEALTVLASRMHQTASFSQNTLNMLLKHSFSYLESFAGSVLRLPTALSLCRLLACLADKADSTDLQAKIATLCESLLKQKWLSDTGEMCRGAKHNELLQTLLKLYISHSDDVLHLLEELAAVGVPELLQNNEKNASSQTFPTLTNNSYPVFYRIMLQELVETVKVLTAGRLPDTVEEKREVLLHWNLSVRIFHILVNLIKAFDARPNLTTILKYGRQFVELFVRNGMPLLDAVFRHHRDDVQALLKNLQLSTRCLHHLCGHSKIIKDVSLTNQVPLLKRCLETFVYRVKAMLSVNKCSDAFWLGNLKNRDLQGEEILSQMPQQANDDNSDSEPDHPDNNNNSDEELIIQPCSTESEVATIVENSSDDESYSETY